MPSFVARVQTRKGIKMISIQAPDKKGAETIARRHGRVTSITRKVGFDLSKKMAVGERLTWMTRMSTMIGSKMGAAEALRLMVSSFNGNIRAASQAMLDRVEAGMDIHTAMAQDIRNFPMTTTALVAAGASAGNTRKALQDAAEFEYQLANAHKGSMGQVWQAIGTFLLAGGVVIGTNLYFGPQIMNNPIFKSVAAEFAWTRTFGDVLMWTMAVMLGVLGAFFLLGTVGRQIAPTAADKIILAIPYYKDLILSRNNHATLYKLSLLVDAGVRIEEALDLTAGSSPRGALKADLLAALKAVRTGKQWPLAMQTLHPTDKAALSLSTNREDIARTLSLLATQYNDLYLQRISTFAPALASLAALFMSLGGLLIFLQTVLPMLQFSANQ